MMKKLSKVFIISILFVMIGSSFVFASTLEVGLDSGIPTLDWQSTTAFPVPHVSAPVFEGLFAWGEDFTPQPELVDTWEHSDNLKVWSFKIREEVPFHNGEELTADDVIASINRWIEVSPRSAELKNLKSIEKVDKYTIKLKLSEAMGDALLYIFAEDNAKLIVMPEEIAKNSDSGSLTEVVGTGPYYFAEYVPDSYMLIKKFEDYAARDEKPNFMAGGKLAMIDEINFNILPEEFTRVSALKNGEIDFAVRLSDSNYEDLEKTDGVEPVVRGTGVGFTVFFNTKAGIMSDVNMRKAFRAAIDSESVLQSVVSKESLSSVQGSLFPKGTAFYNEASIEAFNQHDFDVVKEYLDKAGYDDEPITLLDLKENQSLFRADVAVLDQLTKAGLNIDFRSYDTASWVDARSDPEVMDVFITQASRLYPLQWAQNLTGRYPGWYESDKLNDLFSEMRVASNEEMVELAKEMQKVVFEDAPIYIIGHQQQMYGKNVNLTDEYGNLQRYIYPAFYNIELEE